MAWRMGAIGFVILAAGCASTEPGAAEIAQADPGPAMCREILLPGSNVLETACMTQREWDEYEDDRSRRSREMVRRMQGMGGGF